MEVTLPPNVVCFYNLRSRNNTKQLKHGTANIGLSLPYFCESIMDRRATISSQYTSIKSYACMNFSSLMTCSTCGRDKTEPVRNSELCAHIVLLRHVTTVVCAHFILTQNNLVISTACKLEPNRVCLPGQQDQNK